MESVIKEPYSESTQVTYSKSSEIRKNRKEKGMTIRDGVRESRVLLSRFFSVLQDKESSGENW